MLVCIGLILTLLPCLRPCLQIAAHVLAQHSYRQPGDDGRTGPQGDTIHDMLDGGEDKVGGGQECGVV